ncbi:MAG: hypothetical protein ABW033_01230 [Acidimicrobiia bacterium]
MDPAATTRVVSEHPGARDAGTWKQALLAAVPAWITARVVVLGALGYAHYVADEVRPGRAIVARTVHEGLLAWDGSWYADIASRGYGALGSESLRFFPGFPLLARGLGTVIGDRAALVVIANVAALVAALLLYRLVRWERGDERLATRAAWFLSIAPPAFVFVMGYSDALAIALAIAAFLAMRKGQWWWAAAAALAVGICRPTGFLLAVPIAVEAWSSWSVESRSRASSAAARVAAVVAAPVGSLLYLLWVGSQYDDALLPYRVQTSARLHGAFANPFTTMWHAVEGGFDGRVGTALHVPWLVLLVVLVVVVFRRWPLAYGVFAAVVVASAVTSQNLDSLERYALFAFPLVLALADLAASRLVERIVYVLLPVALFGYATLAFFGLYVP